MSQSLDNFLSRLNGDDQASSRRDPQGERATTLQEIRQAIRGRFLALKDRIDKIRDDTSLSPDGQHQRITELCAKCDLSFLVARQTETESDLQRYRGLLFSTPKSDLDPTLSYLRESEIRRKLEGQPQHELLMRYQLAVNAGDYERQRALTQGPDGSLIPEDFQQRALRGHAQKSQPAVFENFEQAQCLKEHLDSLHLHAQQVLQNLKDERPAPAVRVGV